MDYIKQLGGINWWQAVLAIFVVALAFKFVDELWLWFKNKFGIEFKWDKEKKEQAEIINIHSEQLDSIVESVNTITEEIEKLSKSIERVNEKVDDVYDHISTIDERIDVINSRLDINNEANIMQLYDKLDEKTRYYMDTLHGIPSDELAGYVLLFEQYKKLGGNHGMDIKVNHAIDTLPTIGSSHSSISK